MVSTGIAPARPASINESADNPIQGAEITSRERTAARLQSVHELQADGIEALQKLFAQNGTKPLPSNFATRAIHIKDNFALTDSQVAMVARNEIQNAAEVAGGLSHDRLIATKEYAASIVAKFNLKETAAESVHAIDEALVASAFKNIKEGFAGKVDRDAFRRIDAFADSAELPSHMVKEIARAEVAKRLQRASGPGDDLSAAIAITHEYRLAESKEGQSALFAARGKLMMEKFSDIANTLMSAELNAEQKISFTRETAAKYGLPARTIQELVVKCIEARTARDLAGSSTGADVAGIKAENDRIRLAFDDKGFIQSHARWANAENLIGEKTSA